MCFAFFFFYAGALSIVQTFAPAGRARAACGAGAPGGHLPDGVHGVRGRRHAGRRLPGRGPGALPSASSAWPSAWRRWWRWPSASPQLPASAGAGAVRRDGLRLRHGRAFARPAGQALGAGQRHRPCLWRGLFGAGHRPGGGAAGHRHADGPRRLQQRVAGPGAAAGRADRQRLQRAAGCGAPCCSRPRPRRSGCVALDAGVEHLAAVAPPPVACWRRSPPRCSRRSPRLHPAADAAGCRSRRRPSCRGRSSRSRGGREPVAHVEGQQPLLAGAFDLRLQLRVPPHVVQVHRHAQRADCAAGSSASHTSSACSSVLMQARSAACIGCSGSMASGMPRSRASSSSAAMPSVTCARAPAMSRCAGLAGQRAGQAADHQHQAGRVQRAGFVERAPVVVARGLPAGGIGAGEHAAAAVARQRQAVCLAAAARWPAGPAAATWSRQGDTARMPRAAQASMMSSSGQSCRAACAPWRC